MFQLLWLSPWSAVLISGLDKAHLKRTVEDIGSEHRGKMTEAWKKRLVRMNPYHVAWRESCRTPICIPAAQQPQTALKPDANGPIIAPFLSLQMACYRCCYGRVLVMKHLASCSLLHHQDKRTADCNQQWDFSPHSPKVDGYKNLTVGKREIAWFQYENLDSKKKYNYR